MQDSYVLGIERNQGCSFVIDEDLLVTIHDFDLTGNEPRFVASDDVITLANLRFTRRALESAMYGFVADTSDNETLRIERSARSLDVSDHRQAYDFSKDVCAWGRGGRVWGNLKRFHPEGELGQKISEWLASLEHAVAPSEAIRPGTKIQGLGVSFASKHLRLFAPERFATLDEVISLGLGYALNPAGYNLWLHDLQALKDRSKLQARIADIESGIFVLIRQIVRGTNVGEELLEEAAAG